ncbi:MAG: sugar ABC transporter substrate-binding protein [Candidatus Krumholzibacteria bacterium]|nr:sugar ABC transporter substrate-binding protein [Candidatus Krumholzibacteria bacterium]
MTAARGRRARAPLTGVVCVLLGVAAGLLGGCGGQDGGVTVIRFWAMGREGEVVKELAREFESLHPEYRVAVQQIPWTAAHEKLLTAFVGRATPDLAQLGNTWVSEFAALAALVPLAARVAASATIDPADHFAGIWDTNVIDGELYGVPWYVDTRLLFYRSDLVPEPPATWNEWRTTMAAVTREGGAGRYGILLPVNEWAQPVILGLQAGSTLLRDGATRGAFAEPEFRRAFAFYVSLYQDGLAPPVSNNEVANLYQEFARGTFAMYITGPWNLGEFERRLPAAMQDRWATAPLPGPDPQTPGVSLAGGSSLVLFRAGERQDAAWRFVEFLSAPAQQRRFFALTGNLPAHRAVWDDPALAGPRIGAFRAQLERVVATPKLPEWEQIADQVWRRAEQAVRGGATLDQALAALDADVDRILAKRRWLRERAAAAANAAAEAR